MRSTPAYAPLGTRETSSKRSSLYSISITLRAKIITMGWEEIAADKRKRIEESIPKEWRVQVKDQDGSFMDIPASSGLLTADELNITNSSGVDLVSKLAAGQLKSVDVTLAFCKRAALAHQAVSNDKVSSCFVVFAKKYQH